MKNRREDPAMVEAIARAHESRAQILRSKASGNPAYKKRADEAAREAQNFARRGSGVPERKPDVGTGGDSDPAGAGPATGSEAPETVVIPADWQSLSWQERRSLASQLSDDPITNGEQANAAIEAELKRRG